MRWPIGIALFFVTIISVNAVFIYLAVSGQDEIDPNYLVEANRK